MHRVHEGKIYGVLNDFDLSYQMTDEHPNPVQATSEQRTGTLPFMAIDLLENDPPPSHGYRHDLESFMWVILFHIGQYRDGKSVGGSGPYHQWLLADRKALVLEKIHIRAGKQLPKAQSAFQCLIPWIEQMSEIFFEGSVLASRHDRHTIRRPAGPGKVLQDSRGAARLPADAGKFEVESSGGWITFDKFEEILAMNIALDPINS
jgi:hypothetical protein